MANQPGINIYHLRANTHRRAFDSRTVKIIYRWIVASTRFGISERGGARILSCAHQPLLSAIPIRPRRTFFSSPMIYTYFTQTRTGAIFWHFYQSRIPLGWNEQSIRNMDAMEHGYFCDWWIGRKRLCDVWYWIWWYIYMKLCFISIFIDDDQLVELEDISIEVWKSWKI